MMKVRTKTRKLLYSAKKSFDNPILQFCCC